MDNTTQSKGLDSFYVGPNGEGNEYVIGHKQKRSTHIPYTEYIRADLQQSRAFEFMHWFNSEGFMHLGDDFLPRVYRSAKHKYTLMSGDEVYQIFLKEKGYE